MVDDCGSARRTRRPGRGASGSASGPRLVPPRPQAAGRADRGQDRAGAIAMPRAQIAGCPRFLIERERALAPAAELTDLTDPPSLNTGDPWTDWSRRRNSGSEP